MFAPKALRCFLGLAVTVGVAGAITWTVGYRGTFQVPKASSSVTVLRSSPDVLVAVRALARLESVSYHMERIIDLNDKQSHLFGLIESEDALLLVAVANITAGVDLLKLDSNAIELNEKAKSVRITLPDAEIFSAALDNENTYVHSRKTGFLAQRKEDLETRARVEAERVLVDAARKAGILNDASKNAQRAVAALLGSLGFAQVEVVVSTSHADGPSLRAR